MGSQSSKESKQKIESLSKDDLKDDKKSAVLPFQEWRSCNETITELGSSSLLVYGNAEYKIQITDLKTEQTFAKFQAVDYNKFDDQTPSHHWVHVKAIENTKYLAVVTHCFLASASLEVFDVSRKGRPKQIYSSETISGSLGHDVMYNARRGLLGIIPVEGEIAYHLYSFNTSKMDDAVKLVRKSKWRPEIEGNCGGFDFNPMGELVATFHSLRDSQKCLVADVNTNTPLFHMCLGVGSDSSGRCRWSTNVGEPLLYAKYDGFNLLLLDTEKQGSIIKRAIELDPTRSLAFLGSTNYIDVCPNNGNLLASCGTDLNVKIFDKRELKIVKTFDTKFSGELSCVRWNPNGDKLATTGCYGGVRMWDITTGKSLDFTDDCRFFDNE